MRPFNIGVSAYILTTLMSSVASLDLLGTGYAVAELLVIPNNVTIMTPRARKPGFDQQLFDFGSAQTGFSELKRVFQRQACETGFGSCPNDAGAEDAVAVVGVVVMGDGAMGMDVASLPRTGAMVRDAVQKVRIAAAVAAAVIAVTTVSSLTGKSDVVRLGKRALLDPLALLQATPHALEKISVVVSRSASGYACYRDAANNPMCRNPNDPTTSSTTPTEQSATSVPPNTITSSTPPYTTTTSAPPDTSITSTPPDTSTTSAPDTLTTSTPSATVTTSAPPDTSTSSIPVGPSTTSNPPDTSTSSPPPDASTSPTSVITSTTPESTSTPTSTVRITTSVSTPPPVTTRVVVTTVPQVSSRASSLRGSSVEGSSTTTDTTRSLGTNAAVSSDNPPVNIGAIAGGTVAGVVAIAILIIVLIVWRRRRADYSPAPTAPPEHDLAYDQSAHERPYDHWQPIPRRPAYSLPGYYPAPAPRTPETGNPFLTPNMTQHQGIGATYFDAGHASPGPSGAGSGAGTQYTGLPEPQQADDSSTGVVAGAVSMPSPRRDGAQPRPLSMTVTSVQGGANNNTGWPGYADSMPVSGLNFAERTSSQPSRSPAPPTLNVPQYDRAPSTVYQPSSYDGAAYDDMYPPPPSPPPMSAYGGMAPSVGGSGLPSGAAPPAPAANFASGEKHVYRPPY